MAVEIGGDGYGESVTVAIYVGEEEATRVYLGEELVYDHLWPPRPVA